MIYALLLAASIGAGTPVSACHNAIVSSVKADPSNASIAELGAVRSILIDCVGKYSDDLTKTDIVAAFISLAAIDHELANRMEKEAKATKAAILKAREDCLGTKH